MKIEKNQTKSVLQKLINTFIPESTQKFLWVKHFKMELVNHYVANCNILDKPFVLFVMQNEKNEQEVQVYPVIIGDDNGLYPTFSEKVKKYIDSKNIQKNDGQIILIHNNSHQEDDVFFICLCKEGILTAQVNLNN